MPELTVYNNQTKLTLSYNSGMSIREILEPTKFRVRSSCGGKGKCGLCLIKVDSGNVSLPSRKETEFIDDKLIHMGIRLACQVEPLGDDVVIDKNTPVPKSIWKPLSEDEFSQSRKNLPMGLSVITGLHEGISEIGLTIDIGTTYLRCVLWDLATGAYLAGYYALNPQTSAGSDILTRLMIATRSADNSRELSSLVRETLAECLREARLKLPFPAATIRKVIIVGNTAMLTLFCENNFKRLLEPNHWNEEISYQLEDSAGLRSLWGLTPETGLNLIPSIAGFIGSDLLAGILATKLTESESGSLLIDFGTNTEMALWDGHTVWATATPGGPAFEGSGISCGMPADRGAIYKVGLREESQTGTDFYFDVIGGGGGRGICGTGLVDVLANLLKTGQISRSGQFTGDARQQGYIVLGDNKDIILEKRDIDTLQRAKAPVGAGIKCLLKRAGMNFKDIKRVFVSGTFGRYLNKSNACEIGLLPKIDLENVELWGNTALGGSSLLLFSDNFNEIIYSIKNKTNSINLAMEPEFDEMFIESLYLRPMNIE